MAVSEMLVMATGKTEMLMVKTDVVEVMMVKVMKVVMVTMMPVKVMTVIMLMVKVLVMLVMVKVVDCADTTLSPSPASVPFTPREEYFPTTVCGASFCSKCVCILWLP